MAIDKVLPAYPSDAPNIQTDSQEQFSLKTDSFLTHTQSLVPDINTWSGQANATQVAINTAASNTATSEANAAISATASAKVSGLANYKGEYDPLVTYLTGESVFYGSFYWVSDVDSNLGNTPVEGANWSSISTLATDDYTSISADTTLVASLYYAVTFGVTPLTLTLPLAPVTDDTVRLYNSAGDSTGSIVGRNGQTIMGLAEDLTIDTNITSLQLVFNGSDWRIA